MELKNLLTPPKTVAIIGLSDKPERPSYIVARYLMENGFTIIPVNPTIKEVLGQRAYSSITDIPSDTNIDIVDIFRKSEAVPAIIEEVIATGRKPFIWMQEEVTSQEGQKLAQKNGLSVVMNLCIRKEHLAINS